jgi:pyroglutamyl-peptidase
LSIERVAINLDDARIPDNAGHQPLDVPVIPGAPPAYFSTLPVKRIVQRLQAHGHPATVSYTAGTFVCNHLFFALMHTLTHAMAHTPTHTPTRTPTHTPGDTPVLAGFVHVPDIGAVPRLPGGDMGAPWTLASMVAAVRLLIETLAPGEVADDPLRGGAID